ncbi:MAG TPA: PEGA domain-containing protein [Myxococcales bacterium]|jgi:hypothetical protein
MRPLAPCGLATLLTLLTLLPMRAAGAQAASGAAEREQAAAARYGQGVEHFKAGDMPAALVEFEAAYALLPRFEALFNIAVAHRKLGHYAAAHEAFTRYLADGAQKVPAERRDQVGEALAELDRHVAKVALEVVGGPAQLEVDGRKIGPSPVPLQHLDAGRHSFRAVRSGCPDALDSRELAAGESIALTLRLDPVKPSGPPARVRLSVETAPTAAELLLDDQPVGRAPWSGEVRRGQHLLRAELDGFLPAAVKLDLQGEERAVQLELEPKRWYHHWWVWTVAAVVVAGGATTAAVLATR